MSKRLDPDAIPTHQGSGYPAPFHEPCVARLRQRLGEAADLTDFGVNLLHLPPGAWSNQRHWHTAEDEFVWVLQGEVVLLEVGARKPGDEGEYSDIDMRFRRVEPACTHKDGTPYPKRWPAAA